MIAVPIRLDARTIEKLDSLVRVGRFRSRSEALREIVESYLRREPILGIVDSSSAERVSKAVKALLSLQSVVVDMGVGKTAAKLVAEGRER